MADNGIHSVSFELPGPFVSKNKVYQPGYSITTGRLEFKKSPEWWQWLRDRQRYVPKFEIADGSLVCCEMVLVYPFHYKNGNLKKIDSQNMVGVIIDVVASKQKWDDQVVKYWTVDSQDGSDSRAIIRLIEVRAEHWQRPADQGEGGER